MDAVSGNYLNSQAFRDHDASFDGKRWWAPPNTHPNPLSGLSEDYPDPEDDPPEPDDAP
jgi:hypothetical protein